MSSHGRDKRNDEWPMLFSSIGLDDTVGTRAALVSPAESDVDRIRPSRPMWGLNLNAQKFTGTVVK